LDARSAAAAIEALRRGPLDPELPIDPDAAEIVPDSDLLEVLDDTQSVAEESPRDRRIVGPDARDKRRATILAGGDVDAGWEESEAGEESVGGSSPTPDQDIVDDLGRAAGVTYSDTEPLRPEEKEAKRDEKRWEVDPASAEDYEERQRELRARKRPKR
ncbi:MAG TPA: DUF6335 family protein, partial [Candidatus Binatia bacterium]|nr:DUF6335 family protein [Candidatus Binatia bacterium]